MKRIPDNSSPKDAASYQLVEAALKYFEEHQQDQPTLTDVSEALDVSDGHLHRLFRQWVGLTPKQYLQSITVERAKVLLNQSHSVFDVALEAGLSGGSRLYDHFVTLEAMTPAQYRRDHSSDNPLVIRYGAVNSPFGNAFVGYTDHGICRLTFDKCASSNQGAKQLQDQWPHATLIEDTIGATELMAPIWKNWRRGSGQIRLLVKGTNFQVQVWRALLRIPSGSVVDYSAISRFIGRPTATRAVASAIGANPVACLIPCHRVIRRDGTMGGYRWGVPRKQLILAQEFNQV